METSVGSDKLSLHTLWYGQPATCFEEALPVGAGRFGAMAFGEPSAELLKLNEDSVWSGGKRDRINPNALEGFQKVRQLVFDGYISEAEQLAFQTMQGCSPNMPHYMPLGDLTIAWDLPAGSVEQYRRSLDLNTAVQTTSFYINGAEYSRKLFASVPAQGLVMQLSVINGLPFTCTVSIDGRDDYYDNNQCKQLQDGTILLFTGGSGGHNGIQFACITQAASKDGVVTSCGNRLRIENATEVILVCAMRTSYYHPDSDLVLMAQTDTTHALSHGWAALLADHIADYQQLYSRCDIALHDDIDAKMSAAEIPTDVLLTQIKEGNFTHRNALLSLYFRYGRYLMLSASRPGSLPMNLQGIWNQDMWPAWGCRFTININTQMNYWPAEICGLPECHLPLFDLIEIMRPHGRKTAKEMYGCEGFCCHHNTDLWGDCAPQDLWMPATLWPMGAAWLCLHLYEHYLYSNDIDFLRKKYPTLKEASLFFTDFLIENSNAQLVTCPGVSPENTYRLPNGETGNLCVGPSMDTQIITALFDAVIASSKQLDIDHDYAETLSAMRQRLPQPSVGQYGQIMEWAEDYEEAEPGHRHISQLFALHPAHLISPRQTKELAAAAHATLHRRLSYGGGHTGWSRAWIANMYARLFDADAVMTHLTLLLQHSTAPNLFDMHPPFQIDGNFGGTAAIAEALLQSAPDGITLMPACDAAWRCGSFTGLRAYGGFTISAVWSDSHLDSVEIYSMLGNECRLHLPQPCIVFDHMGQTVPTRKEMDGSICFSTVPLSVYRLIAE